MLNPAVASAVLARIAPAVKVAAVCKPSKKWEKVGDVAAEQDAFATILSRAERRMQQYDSVELMTVKTKKHMLS